MNFKTTLLAACTTLVTIFFSPVSYALYGDAAADLLFTPLAIPCRIADTRLAGSALVANTTRSFDVTAVSDYSFQGGEATNCSGFGAAGSFAAVALNFTVINPNVSGALKAWPFGGTEPTTATVMSFAAGEVRSNFSIVKLDQGASANELNVKSSAAAHITIDVVGYYIQAPTLAMDCEEKALTAISVAAGSTGSGLSPACSAGYTVISGGCTSSNFDGRVVSSRTLISNSTHFCAFRNEGAGNMTVTVHSVCCRLPLGR